MTRSGLQITLLGANCPEHHYPNERAEAVEYLDFAIAELREMKMQPALERALARQQSLKN